MQANRLILPLFFSVFGSSASGQELSPAASALMTFTGFEPGTTTRSRVQGVVTQTAPNVFTIVEGERTQTLTVTEDAPCEFSRVSTATGQPTVVSHIDASLLTDVSVTAGGELDGFPRYYLAMQGEYGKAVTIGPERKIDASGVFELYTSLPLEELQAAVDTFRALCPGKE